MKDRLGTLGQQKEQLSDKEFYRLFLKEHGWPADTEEDRFLDEMFGMELDRDVEREEALLAKHPEMPQASINQFENVRKIQTSKRLAVIRKRYSRRQSRQNIARRISSARKIARLWKSDGNVCAIKRNTDGRYALR